MSLVISRAGELVARTGLTYVALIGVFGVPWQTILALHPEADLFAIFAGTASCAVVALIAWIFRATLLRSGEAAIAGFARHSRIFYLPCLLGVGTAIRLIWALAFPAEPVSDGAIYLQLARQLAAGEPFRIANSMAFWPPGYPLFLSLWLRLILSERVTLILSNLTLFVFGAVGVWKLGHRLLGIPWASAALVLFAFWPNYIAGVASPEKEQLVASLIPWALFLFLRTMTDQRPLASALFGGACLGAACLVQPSLQLLPLVLLCCAVAIGADDSRRRIVACMVFFLAIIAVIAPWTLRNYQIFHRVILITTSAGDNLYRANNPLATGTYTERGSIDLSGLPELQKNDRGRQLALEWIKSNPGRFALLAVKKTLFFMCDDSYAIYSSLKVGKGSDNPLVYLLFKGISTLFWLIFWTYLFVVLVEVWTRGVPGSPAALILPMTFLYLVLIHAIFESQGKYHTPLVGVTALLLPLYLSRVARGRRADRPMPRPGATCEPAVRDPACQT